MRQLVSSVAEDSQPESSVAEGSSGVREPHAASPEPAEVNELESQDPQNSLPAGDPEPLTFSSEAYTTPPPKKAA